MSSSKDDTPSGAQTPLKAQSDSEIGAVANISDIESTRYQIARDNKRQLGIPSASLLIFNRIIGTGIFATPATILGLCGSVGLTLFIWVVGMLIAAAGTAVYMEFGTAMPRNGGEKNYLEFVYRRPKFLTTCLYTGYVILLGWAAGNSVIFGDAASRWRA
ncbi:hypothetical protein NLG97_g4785 [Lecanicillium saksenae]|uniref:Uncharacterized protein n=1 Tax=Lecanicillium saksenae TaxID=468837 RepID=A0ACC1QWW3_9HYPO|nr:hypothetical protein NLG97_g4785 [Lecanicillium saksenae]